ncbi:VanZ family protein [Salipaludibacillus keqinensis]|uniref:VanZ family protein n=2 Tax=Salipaludibacillus keqinensis TaxID=2045207 RepID=A0A323TJ02_9BACI|nr:VanZ family protein [Salipaludibacillus keqinensis]
MERDLKHTLEEKEINDMKVSKIFSWTSVLLWMGLIFYLSHQPATESNELSTGITQMILQAVETLVPFATIDINSFNFFIRKSAHFVAYLVLGVLTIHALRQSGVYGAKSVVTTFVICVAYAISDEVHQLFIPGRSGEVRDVVIDSAGAGTGIGLYFFVRALFTCLKKRKSPLASVRK